MKASVFPSGEKAGLVSEYPAGGDDVILRCSSVSTESRKMLAIDCGDSFPEKASSLPSGDQDRRAASHDSPAELIDSSFRSTPPIAGIRKMVLSPPSIP